MVRTTYYRDTTCVQDVTGTDLGDEFGVQCLSLLSFISPEPRRSDHDSGRAIGSSMRVSSHAAPYALLPTGPGSERSMS
jgi:hypothetical protein